MAGSWCTSPGDAGRQAAGQAQAGRSLKDSWACLTLQEKQRRCAVIYKVPFWQTLAPVFVGEDIHACAKHHSRSSKLLHYFLSPPLPRLLPHHATQSYLVKTPPARPNLVLLALSRTSSSVSNGRMDMTGPKISSFTHVMSSLHFPGSKADTGASGGRARGTACAFSSPQPCRQHSAPHRPPQPWLAEK